MIKMFTEGNQIHNFISSSGSDFLTTVPVPQSCSTQLTRPVVCERPTVKSTRCVQAW